MRFLKAAALLVATLLTISACGAAPDTAATGFPSKASGTLHLYNWTNYISPKLVKKFTEDTGIQVQIDNYSSNEQLVAKLSSGAGRYDVVVPSDYTVEQLIKLGLLERVDPASFPNAKNIKPDFMDVYFDKGRHYTAPYMYGLTGFAYDKTKISERPTSWHEFFQGGADVAGEIGMHDDENEMVNAALRSIGAKPCSTRAADFNKALAVLKKFKPQVKVISSDGTIDRLASGEVLMSSMWNGSYHRAHAINKNLTFVFPTDGMTLWMDNMGVPKGAPNPDAAKVFLNWMMDPKHMALNSNYLGYDNAIEGSSHFMKAELKNDPAVVPSATDMSRAAAVPTCTQESTDLYDRVWTDFKG